MNNGLYKSLKVAGWLIFLLLVVLLARKAFQPNNVVNVDKTKDDWAKLILVLNSVDKDYVDTINHEDLTEKLIPQIL
ncbi:MAG: hypothetical protein WCR82_00475, partial [Bacteroidales bacterium]